MDGANKGGEADVLRIVRDEQHLTAKTEQFDQKMLTRAMEILGQMHPFTLSKQEITDDAINYRLTAMLRAPLSLSPSHLGNL